MKYWVRKVGSHAWCAKVGNDVKEWHQIRLQPPAVMMRKLEKKAFNAAQVGTTRKRAGKHEEGFCVTWLASEIHPAGYAPSPVFARAERLVANLCVALRTLGYGAEPVHDDTTYICHPSSAGANPLPVSRLGIRISNLLEGNQSGAVRLYRSKRLVTVPLAQDPPKLVRKS